MCHKISKNKFLEAFSSRGLICKRSKEYFSITNNEIVQNSKSEPEKFSFLCTFKSTPKLTPTRLPWATLCQSQP